MGIRDDGDGGWVLYATLTNARHTHVADGLRTNHVVLPHSSLLPDLVQVSFRFQEPWGGARMRIHVVTTRLPQGVEQCDARNCSRTLLANQVGSTMHDLTQLGETDASFAWLLLGVQDGQYVRCIFACHVPSFGRCNPQQFLRIHAAHMAILDGVKETPQIAKREEILEKQLEFLQALSNRS